MTKDIYVIDKTGFSVAIFGLLGIMLGLLGSVTGYLVWCTVQVFLVGGVGLVGCLDCGSKTSSRRPAFQDY